MVVIELAVVELDVVETRSAAMSASTDSEANHQKSAEGSKAAA